MAKDVFSFKQFSVHQDRCAMKVGTDGVLIGAWGEGGARILDVGSGSGLVALMMAQRYPASTVVGVEMDAQAALQAQENVAASCFAARVSIVNQRLQDYCAEEPFDSVVSNPPFFVNSLKSPSHARTAARHADTLSYADLFRGVKRLLAPQGVFSAVIPTDCSDEFMAEAVFAGLYLVRKVAVCTTPNKLPKRLLLCFSRLQPETLEQEQVYLQNADGTMSEWFITLTHNFYLDK